METLNLLDPYINNISIAVVNLHDYSIVGEHCVFFKQWYHRFPCCLPVSTKIQFPAAMACDESREQR